MARVSLPFVKTSFTGKELETMTRGVNALKHWTWLSEATLVYDSKTDPYTADGLFDRIRGVQNVALIGFTTDGDVFGGFYSKAVTGQEEYSNDPSIFAFSFESHGRCMAPQRFVRYGGWDDEAMVTFENTSKGFVHFWVYGFGGFSLGNERSKSNCWNMSYAFEGLKDTTLTGKNSTNDENPPFHHCIRLVAVHLE